MQIKLLGPLQIEQDGQIIQGFRSQKALALLAYLIEAKRPLSRTALAVLFWPDVPESKAKEELRKVLHNLTTKLPDCLTIDRSSVHFQPGPDCWVDTIAFSKQVQDQSIASLQKTAVFIRGPFLEGLLVDDSPEWETWLLTLREQWQQRSTHLLETLAAKLTQTGNLDAAIETSRRLLTIEPWRETTHRQLMRLLARRGDRRAALSQFTTCRRILAEELAVTPEPETVALYERIKTAVSHPSPHLPLPPTPFIGREQELERIAHQLAANEYRLLTLVGPGGMGKTRLALQAAHTQRNRFLDGVYFVPVTAVSTTNNFATAITNALNLTLTANDNLLLQLGHFLAQKEVLLILDNCETLLDQSPQIVQYIAELLTHAPALRLLATSRQALNLRGEWLLQLDGLHVSKTQPTASQAVLLFAQTASRVYPSFALEAERDDVLHICSLVAGMPLAIELAAGWRKLLPCRDIALELAGGLNILSSPHSDFPDRHQNLNALFKSSLNRLPKDEQAVIHKLALFPAPFTREAATAVSQATLPTLANLVDNSMLAVQETSSPTQTRYALHPLLRQFCLDSETAVINQARHAYIRTFTQQLQSLEADLQSANRQSALQAISADIDNIRAGWQWAQAASNWAAVAACLQPLHLFFELKGWFREAAETFAEAAAQLTQTAPTHPLRPRLQSRHGWHAWRLGQLDQAQALAAQSFPTTDDPAFAWEKAFVHHLLGLVAHARGDYATANAQFGYALTIWRSLDDAWGTAVSLFRLGQVHLAMGDYQQARRPYWEGLALVNEVGYQFGATTAVGELSRLAAGINDYANARELCAESVTIHKSAGDPWGVAAALDNLGIIHCGLWQFEMAEEKLQSSLAIRRQLNDQPGIASTLDLLGQVAFAQEHYEKTIEFCQQSLAIHQQLGNPKGVAVALNNQGRTHYLMGNYELARTAYAHSLNSYQLLGHRAGEAAVLGEIGFVDLAVGAWETAVSHFNNAFSQAIAINAIPVALDVLLGKAELLRVQGHESAAQELLAVIKGHPALHDGVHIQAQRLFGTQAWTAVSATLIEVDLETAVTRILQNLDRKQ